MKDVIYKEIWISTEMSQCCNCASHVLLFMKINWESNLRVVQIVIVKTMHSKWHNFTVIWGMWGVWNASRFFFAMSHKQFRLEWMMLFGMLLERLQGFGSSTVYCRCLYKSREKAADIFFILLSPTYLTSLCLPHSPPTYFHLTQRHTHTTHTRF